MRLKLYTLILSILSSLMSLTAATFSDESLDYKVMYKWGLINKQAGHATLTLRNQGDQYITQLTAASEKWADRFYMVRDTLNGIIIKRGFLPIFYEKIAHEGGDYKHDIVNYTRNGNNVTGHCTRVRQKNKKKPISTDTKILEAQGATIDMLSAFYYMRSLNYPTMKTGESSNINIFSGKRKELLTITFHGLETIEYDDRTYNCYRISFTFTSDGKTKTSDDMDAWITADSRRIPVRLEGKLPVGKVRCFYTGK